MSEMFHPGRFNLKLVPSNNVLCTTVMYSNTFTLCVAAQFLTARLLCLNYLIKCQTINCRLYYENYVVNLRHTKTETEREWERDTERLITKASSFMNNDNRREREREREGERERERSWFRIDLIFYVTFGTTKKL